MNSKLTHRQRELLKVQRLQRLINREGNGVRVQFFTISDPAEDRTPDIDIDATPSDIDSDAEKDVDHEA